MEKVRVFRSNKRLAIAFLVIAMVTVAFGMILLIGEKKWNGILFILQGILLGIIFGMNLLNRKYYIEWDDKQLRFLLPDTKIPESIELNQVMKANIKLFEVELILAEGTRKLNLESLDFEDLRKIKEKFEGIGNTKTEISV